MRQEKIALTMGGDDISIWKRDMDAGMRRDVMECGGIVVAE